MISATLVTGKSPARREAAIAAAIVAHASMAAPGSEVEQSIIAFEKSDAGSQPVALLLEGFPSGREDSPLAALTHSHPLQPMRIARIAAGCLCCTGNLTMRVTLNRMLRERPPAAHLFIGTDDNDHLPALRNMLQTLPYSDWLTLTADLETG